MYKSSVYVNATIECAGEPLEIINGIAVPNTEEQQTKLEQSSYWEVVSADTK